MSEENVEIVRAALEAVQRGDWSRLSTIFDERAVVHPDPSWPEQFITGRDAVIDWAKGLREMMGAAWEGAASVVQIEEVHDLGDRVLLRLRVPVRGAHSGVEGHLSWSQITTLRDGRIMLVEFYLDHHQALNAAGLHA